LSVQPTVHVGHGYVTLGSGDYLEYLLSPAGIAQGAFACEHRKPIVPINGAGNQAWILTTTGALSSNVFLIDQGLGVYDAYVVTILFAQAQAYKLRVVKQPVNVPVQDIDFLSNSSSDFYHQPLMVEKI
jgi:hypothetical protein